MLKRPTFLFKKVQIWLTNKDLSNTSLGFISQEDHRWTDRQTGRKQVDMHKQKSKQTKNRGQCNHFYMPNLNLQEQLTMEDILHFSLRIRKICLSSVKHAFILFKMLSQLLSICNIFGYTRSPLLQPGHTQQRQGSERQLTQLKKKGSPPLLYTIIRAQTPGPNQKRTKSKIALRRILTPHLGSRHLEKQACHVARK